MNKVLEGVKVVELSTYAAAPGVGRMLADFGAEVIKIEPLAGDPYRLFGLTVSAPVAEDENPVWVLGNSNKRGITLNLKSEEGKEILYKLLKDANIFFTNTRMDSLVKLGLSYEDLQPKFPHLIYGHISGFGLEGEDASLPGYDITAFWARGGALVDLGPKGTGPITTPYAMGDHSATLALGSGLLGALYKQTKTGQGEKVLVSLFGTSLWITSLMSVPVQYGDRFPKSRLNPMSPIANTYRCADDEYLNMTILDYARDWPRFCIAIGREDLTNDERYSTVKAGKEHSEELVPLIAGIMEQQPRQYWIDTFKKYDLPCAKAQHMLEAVNDPLAKENGYVVEYTFENGNKCSMPCTPVQFGRNVAAHCGPAPKLGEHTAEVLSGLGYSAEQIAELSSKKVVSVYKK